MTARRGAPRHASRPAALVVAAAVLWGTSGTAQELGPPGTDPVAVAALRSLLGGGLLVAVVWWGRGARHLRGALSAAPGAFAAAAASMAVFQIGYFGGIHRTGVAVGTLVAIGTAPVTAGVLDLVRGRRPGPWWVVATAVTAIGTALLLLPGADDVSVRVDGVALALLAGAAYATYAVASKTLLDRGVDGPSTVAGAFVGATLLLAPLLVVADVAWVATPRGASVLLWLGVMTIALGYLLFARGLTGLQAAAATTLTLAEPATATLLAVVLLGETLTGAALLGTALVGVGLVIAARARRPGTGTGPGAPAGGDGAGGGPAPRGSPGHGGN